MTDGSPGNAIRIRPMTVDDLDPVVAIDQLSFSLPWPARSFRFEVLENPASRCFVAVDEHDRIAGMTVIWLIEDEAHIATFAVHPLYRRMGIGRKMLVETLAVCVRQGAKTATLEVRAGNDAAQQLYRAYGFVEVNRRPRYYADNNEDALIMTVFIGDKRQVTSDKG
jgi:ribosomal-protein-alanine N-acetyltransferase